MEAFIVKAKLRWAKINEATGTNAMSGKYQTDLTDLSAEDFAKLAAFGVGAKEKDGVKYVTAKAQKPVRVIGKDKTELVGAKPGNGTEANVLVKPYEWEFKGKKGVGLGLQAVQVLNLVEFTDVFPDLSEETSDGTDNIPF